MDNLLAPVSVGELIDKITILEIKKSKISDSKKLANVNHELELLTATWSNAKDPQLNIDDLIQKLSGVNQALWEIEDKIRIKEANAEFDQEFIELARSVYVQNDLRAAVKKEINARSGSELTEEKHYQDY